MADPTLLSDRGFSSKVAALLAVAAAAATSAGAASESVVVIKALEDKAIVRRSNGEHYLVYEASGCSRLFRQEGKTVIADSPGQFLGRGATLAIPGETLKCRIWYSERASAPPPPTASSAPPLQPTTTSTGATVQLALQIVGYYSGPVDGVFGPSTAKALGAYAAAKGHDSSERGLQETLSDLALDVIAKRPSDTAARQLSRSLLRLATRPQGKSNTSPSRPRAATPTPRLPLGSCEDGHWVESVSGDGEIVKLEDGSLWEIDPVGQVDTSLWLPTDPIVVCGGKLINTDSGDSVEATRLR